MCLQIVDKYTDSIEQLEKNIERNAIKTWINEKLVLDLIATIKEDEPPLPNISDPNVFRFYFLNLNKEYK